MSMKDTRPHKAKLDVVMIRNTVSMLKLVKLLISCFNLLHWFFFSRVEVKIIYQLFRRSSSKVEYSGLTILPFILLNSDIVNCFNEFDNSKSTIAKFIAALN